VTHYYFLSTRGILCLLREREDSFPFVHYLDTDTNNEEDEYF